jgi:hypothetical protein
VAQPEEVKAEEPKKEDSKEKANEHVAFFVHVIVQKDGQVGYQAVTPDGKGVLFHAIRDALSKVSVSVTDSIAQGIAIDMFKKLVDDNKLIKPGFRASWFDKLKGK